MSIDLSQYKEGDRIRIELAEPLQGSITGVIQGLASTKIMYLESADEDGVGFSDIDIASIERVLPDPQPGDWACDSEGTVYFLDSRMQPWFVDGDGTLVDAPPNAMSLFRADEWGRLGGRPRQGR